MTRPTVSPAERSVTSRMPSTRRSSTSSWILAPIASTDVWYGNSDTRMRWPPLASSSISAVARMRIEPRPGAVVLGDAGPAEDRRAGREVGTGHELHEVFDGRVGVVDQVQRGVDDLAQVVRRDVGGHADRDAAAAVDQQVREARRHDERLAVAAVVGVAEVDGVLVDLAEQLHRELRQPRFGVTGRGRAVVRANRSSRARRSAGSAARSPAPCARARRRSTGRRAGGTCPSPRRPRSRTCGAGGRGACPRRTCRRGSGAAPASSRRARRAARATVMTDIA